MSQHFWKASQKKIVFLFLILFIFLLSGCWDRREVNDLALIRGAGIDKKQDGKMELTVLLYIPKGGGSEQGMEGSSDSGNMQTLIRSAQGNTIAEAMSILQEKLPRQIFWSHCEVFIFNETIAKEGLAEHVDFFMRMPELRERAQLFISKQRARKILSLLPPLERDLAEVVRELGEHKIGMTVTTKDFAEMLVSEAGDTAVPWIKILPPIEGQEEKRTIAYISGTAIFKRDKMVGKINDSLTRGLLWLRDEIKYSTISVTPKGEKGYVSMKLLRANSKIIPKIQNGKWEIVLKAEADDDIIQNTTNLDVANPKVVKSLEQQLNIQLAKRVHETLKEVQKGMKADVFGFADAFHRKYPEAWKREKNHWDEIFPTIEVTVSSKIKIQRQGMHSVLPQFPKEKVKEE
ncbi:Ger(x)C family spore germination protein [Neobacillus bataviensis]|uniref:Ger(x)C family spore germination protein n=1 Tax=Neobacillus bataviensis TaxID=220685 RepID=UPI001CBD11D3|nr:Ger(x)C family spore germination protein [Neobacillus bataviensis]